MRNPFAVVRALDQRVEPAIPGLISLCAHDPIAGGPAVPRCLAIEKLPGSLPQAKPRLPSRVEADTIVLVGVDARPSLVSCLECGSTSGMYETLLLQLSITPDVDSAPNAAFATRRNALGRHVVAERVPHAVDPAEAELLVNDLLPGDCGSPRTLAMVSKPQLGGSLVVRLEPGAQLGRSLEEDDVSRCRQSVWRASYEGTFSMRESPGRRCRQGLRRPRDSPSGSRPARHCRLPRCSRAQSMPILTSLIRP